MEALGFRHFAQQSPYHLALATPDGRHWTRAQLLGASERLAANPLHREAGGASPLNSVAEAIATALAGDTRNPAAVIQDAIHLMAPLGITAEQDNIHLCVAPVKDVHAFAWILASVHYGHPVVMANAREAEQILRNIERYRITTSCMASEQLADLLALPESIRRRYHVSSMRHLLLHGEPCPAPVRLAVQNWWNVQVHSCRDRHTASTPEHLEGDSNAGPVGQ